MNGPPYDEAEVEERMETRSVFERLAEDGVIVGVEILELRSRLHGDVVKSERRVRFRRAVRTLERRGPRSAWALRQMASLAADLEAPVPALEESAA